MLRPPPTAGHGPPPRSPYRPQWRSPACSSPSRGPAYRRRRPTPRRGCIGVWTSAPGCDTSTRTDRWRRSTSYARYPGDRRCLCHFESPGPRLFPATFSCVQHLLRPIFPCDSFRPSGFDGLQCTEMTQWQLHCDQVNMKLHRLRVWGGGWGTVLAEHSPSAV